VNALAVTVARAVLAVALVASTVHRLVLQERQELVVLAHKVVMDLVDTQEQVVVQVLHLEQLVTLA
jgi:hypothetical protein